LIMRILLTGHTGFKGTWATFLLSELGYEVHGISLPLSSRNWLYQNSGAKDRISSEIFADIGKPEELHTAIRIIEPEQIWHFASQSLVSVGYDQPGGTFRSNVAGTLNLLNAIAENAIVLSGLLVATSDKVYSHETQAESFLESDALGGKDPYSASKAVQDFMVQQRISSDPNWASPTNIVRAGNVIGYGDTAENRLFPDIVRAWQKNDTLVLRNPSATRPWQHVLDCIGGYLLASKGTGVHERNMIGIWNFGPLEKSQTVSEVVRKAKSILNFKVTNSDLGSFEEMQDLKLDSSKARNSLSWKPSYSLEEAIELTLQPIKQNTPSHDILALQVRNYLNGLTSRF
jgi:CDP-glucose 4,6-dehydratase